MKNLLLVLLVMFLSSAATKMYYDVQKNTAEVYQEQGIYIFSDSKPVLPYDYLGTIKAKLTWGGDYDSIKNFFLNKVKKDYPTCNAIIITDASGNVPKADAIFIKD